MVQEVVVPLLYALVVVYYTVRAHTLLRIAQQLSQLLVLVVCKITCKNSSRDASFLNFYIERDRRELLIIAICNLPRLE